MKRAMMQRKSHSRHLLATMCGLVLFATQAGFAQQSEADQRHASQAAAAAPLRGQQGSAKPSGEEEETAKPAKPGREGINIHGHWVLERKSAEGKLIERREFENSLVTGGFFVSGDQVLAALLSGNAVAGDPGILFATGVGQSGDPSQICGNGGQGIGCYLFTTATSPLNESATFFKYALGAVQTTQTGLSVAVNYSPSVSWVLSGNFTVPSGVTVLTTVQTTLPLCGPYGSINTAFGGGGTNDSFHGSFGDLSGDLAPKACIAGETADSLYPAILTSTPIQSGGVATPMTVTAGQVITVTVTISFS